MENIAQFCIGFGIYSLGFLSCQIMHQYQQKQNEKHKKESIQQPKIKVSAKDLPSTPDMKRAYYQKRNNSLIVQRTQQEEPQILKKIKTSISEEQEDDQLSLGGKQIQQSQQEQDQIGEQRKQDGDIKLQFQTPIFIQEPKSEEIILDSQSSQGIEEIKEIAVSPQLKKNKFSLSPA